MHQNTDWEKKIREDFHSFWNNSLYGEGDTEPVFPSYAEIQDFWLSKLQAREEWLHGEITKIMNDYEEPDFEFETADAIQKHAVKTFNRILALINKK